jgi:hypothetical protein
VASLPTRWLSPGTIRMMWRNTMKRNPACKCCHWLHNSNRINYII